MEKKISISRGTLKRHYVHVSIMRIDDQNYCKGKTFVNPTPASLTRLYYVIHNTGHREPDCSTLLPCLTHLTYFIPKGKNQEEPEPACYQSGAFNLNGITEELSEKVTLS